MKALCTRAIARLKARLDGSDDGSVLILALIIILVVGVIMASVLSYASTGITMTPQLRQARNATLYDQGALDGAINNIRGSSVTGRTGHACPTYTVSPPDNVLSDGAGTHTYSVQCNPKSVPGGTNPDTPDWAILALSTKAGEGIIQPAGSSNNMLNIDGGIYSNSDITVQSGNGNTHNFMFVNGTAIAEGSCTPSLIVTTDANRQPICGAAHDPLGSDPGYAPAVTSSILSTLPVDPVPSCPSSHNYVTFFPGLYTVTPAALATAAGCNPNNSQQDWWFKPASPVSGASGRYYFNYVGTWTIANGIHVVGGTPPASNDWVTANNNAPAQNACDHDIAPTSSGPGSAQSLDGVQFAFGGSAFVNVPSTGSIEVCGPRQSQNLTNGIGDPQRIAIYGYKTGAAPSGSATTLTASPAVAPATNPTSTTYLNPGGASGSAPPASPAPPPATAVVAGNTPAILSYTGFTNVTNGSKFDTSTANSVVLKVTHAENNAASAVLLRSSGDTTGTKFNVPACSVSSPAPPTVTPPPSLCTSSVDITSYFAPTSARPVPWRSLNTLTVDYCATQGNNASCTGNGGNQANIGTSFVNGMSITLTPTQPALEAQHCANGQAVPTCTPVFWDSSVNNDVQIHGTVYVPGAGMSVDVQNTDVTIFDRGVIVYTLTAYVSGSSKQTTSPFSLPGATPRGREVLFTEYEDGNVNNVKVRACILYSDTTPYGQALPGYAVHVKSFSVLPAPDGQDPATYPCP